MDFTRLKQLFTEEDAVSPVIGVILMVAITVILAAVIGTFVLGLGENVQDSAPQANFQFEYTGDFETSGYAADDTITITHTGGEDVSVSELTINVDGVEISNLDTTASYVGSDTWSSTVATGDSLLLVETGTTTDDENFDAGETVRVIWTSPSGGTSNTIGQSTVPS